MNSDARGAADDGGFTLIELLVVIAISVVVLGALSQVVIVYLRASGQPTARLIESRDAQTTASYFGNDVAAIGTRDFTDPISPVLKQSVEIGVSNSGGLYPCGTSGTAAVRLVWDDASKGTAANAVAVVTVTRVAYSAQVTATGRFELHRLLCRGSSTPVSDIVIAHDLTVAPAVTCDVTCTGSGSAVPATVTMTLTSKDPLSRLAPISVILIGQRRQS
jgi:prepilin-type N-terminal cleavage/methylation domain-containing protein